MRCAGRPRTRTGCWRPRCRRAGARSHCRADEPTRRNGQRAPARRAPDACHRERGQGQDLVSPSARRSATRTPLHSRRRLAAESGFDRRLSGPMDAPLTERAEIRGRVRRRRMWQQASTRVGSFGRSLERLRRDAFLRHESRDVHRLCRASAREDPSSGSAVTVSRLL